MGKVLKTYYLKLLCRTSNPCNHEKEKEEWGVIMNKKSWLVRYFTSYLAIGVLPVVIFGCFLYYMNVVGLNKEVQSNNYSALAQSLNKIDYLVEKMNNISYHLSRYQFESNVQYENFKNFSITDDSVIAQRLKSYEDTLGVPVQALLYIRGDTNIYTSEDKYHYSEFEHVVQRDGDLTMSRFYTMISSIRCSSSMFLVHKIDERLYNGGMTVYLYPIPYMDVLPTATLGFMFKEKDIQNIILNYLGEIKGNIYIYNEYLQEIFKSEQIQLVQGAKDEYVSMKGKGVSEQHINDVDYVVMRDVSPNSGFSIIFVTEEKDFYNKVNLMKMVLILSIVLLLVIAVLQAIVMSRQSYRPLKKLVAHMGGKLLDSKKVSINEFDFIENHWESIESKNKELHYLVDWQRPMVVYSCLSNLLQGKISTADDLDFSLKCANVNLKSPFVFVMLIVPVNENLSDITGQTHNIISIIEELILPYGRLYGVELISENRVAVISNCDKKEISGEEIRTRIAHTIQKSMVETFGSNVHIGVGRIYENILQINLSFMEAMVVVSDFMPTRKIDIAFFEDAAAVATQGNNYQYPVIEQALYIQSMKQVDQVVALKSLDDMIEKVSETGSFVITQCRCYDIINIMIKTANQINCELELGDIKSLCTFSNLDEFKKHARKLTIQICKQYEQFKEQRKSKMKAELINYVNAHFCETDMSLESVANYFDISANHLSRLYKQETGCNFTQYITMLRMDQVKAQLIHTDYQIKDIVMQVGYIDVASFTRKFKSYEGMTPGQYREQMRRNF